MSTTTTTKKPATARERELVQRHLDELINMRDEVWGMMVIGDDAHTQNRMMKHQALVYAIELCEAALEP